MIIPNVLSLLICYIKLQTHPLAVIMHLSSLDQVSHHCIEYTVWPVGYPIYIFAYQGLHIVQGNLPNLLITLHYLGQISMLNNLFSLKNQS